MEWIWNLNSKRAMFYLNYATNIEYVYDIGYAGLNFFIPRPAIWFYSDDCETSRSSRIIGKEGTQCFSDEGYWEVIHLWIWRGRSYTGWPVKHGRIFLVPRKSDLSSVHVYKVLATTRPCITGHPVYLYLPPESFLNPVEFIQGAAGK